MKPVATLAAVSLLALGGAAAVAQPAPPPAPPPGATAPDGGPDRGPAFTRAELDSLTNARIAGIKAGLALTPDQQRLFEPVEQALRTMATNRAERMEGFRRNAGTPPPRLDLSQRLELQAERATRAAQSLTTLSSAVKPFYASLDDSQKKLLPMLMRRGGGGFGRRMAMRYGERRGMMERGAPHP
jgi:hypothetical protein